MTKILVQPPTMTTMYIILAACLMTSAVTSSITWWVAKWVFQTPVEKESRVNLWKLAFCALLTSNIIFFGHVYVHWLKSGQQSYRSSRSNTNHMWSIKERIQCSLCPRSPTVGQCISCGKRCCRGCIEEATTQCWPCLGCSEPQMNSFHRTHDVRAPLIPVDRNGPPPGMKTVVRWQDDGQKVVGYKKGISNGYKRGSAKDRGEAALHGSPGVTEYE